MKSFKLFLPILFLLQNCNAQPADALQINKGDNTLLWQISGNNLAKPSYLFGTFHLMCKEDIHFSEQLKQSLKNTEQVYFEMDIDDPSNTLGALLVMNMKGNKTLQDLYTKIEYGRLVKFFKDSLGMPMAMMETMKPAFLEVMLYPKIMPCKNMSGVEEELMKLAKENKKTINGFETIAFQAAVFDSIPYEQQAKELLKTIDSINTYKKYFDTMLTVYKTQQLSEIEKMFSKTEFGIQDNQDILLDNRNKNWIVRLNKIMPVRAVFIAVGAGHLVGEKGLIALLRKEGYTLTPIYNR